MSNSGAQQTDDYRRYCPDDPKVHISDAICHGRQRVGYPLCKECPFNDTGGDGIIAVMGDGPGTQKESRPMIASMFKAYDVRATYPEPLDEEAAWRIGNATAQFLRASLHGSDRGSPEANTIVVGYDMRRHSPSLSEALIQGALAAGANVVNIGMVDTPQVYFAVNHLGACGGIQTTASHNPAEYNGFKICGQKGRPVGENTGLQDIYRIASKIARHDAVAQGTIRKQDLSEPYKRFVRGFLRPTRPVKVAVDASNGMAGRWFPILFDDVENLEIIKINFEHGGTFVHEPNPLVDANLAQLCKGIRKHRADFGICFDGDADRLRMVDERGEIIPCDMLTAVLAIYFLEQAPGSTVVYDLRSSKVVREEIEKAGGTARRDRVGHAFMKKAMADSDAIFGGELSGHFYFRDNWSCDSGMLAFVHMLNVINRRNKAVSELIAPVRRYAASGERNFENEHKDETIAKLGGVFEGAEVDHLDGITVQYPDWWFNVRKSNTEPLLRLNLEVEDASVLEARVAEVARHLGKHVAH
ncbi:MAG: phosphomannomutase/phosphoglucomutase [Phycisphaerales bacterium]|nr:MAG: phosphomannomutase/phosphoglucomutase [Phycisphaerales bacterium]